MVRRNAAVGAVLGLVVAGGALLVSGEEPVDADKADAKVKAIAERVEQLRGLQFERMPKVRRVTAGQLKQEAIKQQEELSGKDLLELEADGQLLKILGFIDAEADLAGSAPDTSEIAGTYDFKSKQLTIVKDVPKSEIPPEIVYAHELAHALEDQSFGLGNPDSRGDDSAQAWRAVGEGSATFLEARYAKEHFDADVSSREIAKSDPASTEDAAKAYEDNVERFVYLDGARFIARLHRAGGWKLVDRALQQRPPRTTEQILHPDAYLKNDQPVPVELETKWMEKEHQRLTAGQFGEFDVGQMLLLGARNAKAAKAAEGWEGGRYELWQKDDRPALVIALTWESAEDVAEFMATLPDYLERLQRMQPAGPGRWKRKGGYASVTATKRETTLVLATDPKLAQKLATTARGRP